MRPQRSASSAEHFQRLVLLGILGVSLLAILLAALMVNRSPGLGPADHPIAMVVTASIFGGMLVALWLNWISARVVGSIGLAVMAAYQLGNLLTRVLDGKLLQSGLGDGSAWFYLFPAMAFLFLRARTALWISALFYCIALIIIAAAVVTAYLGDSFSVAALNPIGQFLMSNLVLLVMTYWYARSQQEYIALHHLAHTDPLTGLPNRRSMHGWLAREAERSRRPNFSVILADLDHFKQINDQYGHAVGDQVLKEIALRFGAVLRMNDQVCRWGGEEFLILASDTDAVGAQRLAERLGEEIRKVPVLGKVTLTVSLGLACWRAGDSLEALINRADTALYRAKALGRNRLELEA